MHVIDQPQAKSSAYKIAASVNDGLAYEIALVLQEFTGEMIVCEKSCVLVC